MSVNYRPMTPYPLRKVVKSQSYTTRYNRPGEGGIHFWLECGHEAFAKASGGSPKQKRCRDCGLGR